ncbi:MAG: iron-siderophore ABC transporter substrate-binding protein, partial [Mycobacteriaceae bacterium]|nr:iron-siderophore ABC transporter substrate-binding protein [Mycobacteriaceae bacterium]
ARIVAAALPDDTDAQPSYLGTVVHNLPAAGTRGSPDLGAVAAAKPDLILTPRAEPALSAIAPTVLTSAPGARWQDNLRTVGTATGRRAAADELIAGFAAQAREAGAANDAVHFQASVVQFTDTVMRVWGAENFPASVLAAVGVDPEILGSDAWRALSANRDNRVFAVNNEVWHTGQGLIAARGILEDLRWLNAPIN